MTKHVTNFDYSRTSLKEILFVNRKVGLWIILILVIIVGAEIRIGYTQSSSQPIEDRVAELEKKLADVKTREEKAQSVRKQLEEQEQKLIGLEKYLESDKQRIQVIEIRMSIKSIYTKIEAITKEKDNLEQNLQFAKNLQIMLRDKQSIINNSDLVSKKTPCGRLAIDKTNSWQVGNVLIKDSLN